MGLVGLLVIYFSILALVSGWEFTLYQFSQYWYFVISLAVGFGIQISLYVYLKNIINKTESSDKVLALSGTTSAGAMISCCAHYLVSILPIIGITGFVSVISQYQVELFWVGLIFNLGGIVYIGNKVIKIHQQI